MNTKIALEFLTRCFRPEETIALLLRRENPPSTAQRIVRLEQAIAPRYLAWLAYQNHTGQTSMSLLIRFIPAAASAPKKASRKFAISIWTSTRMATTDWQHFERQKMFQCRASFFRPRPTSTRCFGASKASTSISRKPR